MASSRFRKKENNRIHADIIELGICDRIQKFLQKFKNAEFFENSSSWSSKQQNQTPQNCLQCQIHRRINWKNFYNICQKCELAIEALIHSF